MGRTRIFTLSIFWSIWVIFVAFFTYYSLSIYKNHVGGETNVLAATWVVSATSDDSNVALIAGTETATYQLTVANESNVKVIYSIELSDLPENIEVKIDDGEYITESDNKITFSEIGVLSYDETKIHTLTFHTPITSEEITNQNINIHVTFTQNEYNKETR